MDIYEVVERFYQSEKIEKTVIGKSAFGRNIYAFKIGYGAPLGIAQYAIHGREYVTALLAIEHIRRGLECGGFWVIPLMNPDGALLSQVGLQSVKGEREKKRLLQINGGNADFSLWKANGRGVDLNVNFPAYWGKGAKNTRVAGAENYIGETPFSEPETQALKRFTLKVKPQYTLSFHTKGEEIYWYFHQSIRTCLRDKKLALAVSASTGYPLSYAKGSVGGYKDWCIKALKIPAMTIEVGKDIQKHPLGEEALEDIVEKNANVLYDLSREYLSI